MEHTSIKILYCNTNHSRRSVDVCLETAHTEKAQIAVLTEPHIDKNNGLRAPGWRIHLQNRVAVLIKTHIKHTRIHFNNPNIIGINIGELSILAAYASPNERLPPILDDLSHGLEAAQQKQLVLGDFNCRTERVPGFQTNTRGRVFEQFLDNNTLQLAVTQEHTWQSSRYSGINDYFATSPQINCKTKVLQVDSLSDHKMQQLEVNVKIQTQTKLRINFNTLATKIAEMGNHINTKPSPKSIEEIEEQLEALEQNLQQAMDYASAPMPDQVIPWWNPKLTIYKETLQQINYKLRRIIEPLTRNILQIAQTSIRRKYRKAIRQAKMDAWKQFTTRTSAWGLPYTVMKKTNYAQLGNLQKEDGGWTTTADEVSEIMLKCKFPDDSNTISPGQWTGSPSVVPKITGALVTKLLKDTSNQKAPGPDRINNKTIKILNKVFPALLPRLYTACLMEGHFPSRWKQEIIVFIPKPGKDPTTPEGFRPITLLNNMGKLFERIIKTILDQHLENINFLNSKQFGFRKGYSTEKAVLSATNTIEQFTQKNTLTAVISLDIQGAFDHARWANILDNIQNMGCPHYLVRILVSYFTERQVSHGNITKYIQRGCPQGSVLGPLLWNCTFNSVLDPIPNEPNSDIALQAFADDTLLICSTDDPALMQTVSAEATKILIQRLESKGLKLNESKSEAILYNKLPKWRKEEPLEGDPEEIYLQIGSTIIEPKRSLKFLGVILDNSLTWDLHIEMAIKKATKALPTLTAICQNLFGYSYKARRIMVHGCILTHLTYCSSIFYHRVALRSNRKKN